jgi:hypothetical protein
MVRIPEREMLVAKSLGMTDAETLLQWERYVTKTTERYGENILLGGKHWRRWLDEYRTYSTAKRDRAAEAKHQRALEDDAYRREAMSLADWVAQLARRILRAEQLPWQEQIFVQWWGTLPEPKPTGLSAVWAFGQWRASQGLRCDCPVCRTVKVVDDAGAVVRTRTQPQAPLGAPQLPAITEAPVRAPTDEDYAARRAQGVAELNEFTAGRGPQPEGT